MSCVYHDRSKGEGCGKVKSIYASSIFYCPFQGNASAVVYYFHYCMSCVPRWKLYFVAIWPVFVKESVLLAFCLWSFDCGAVALSTSFFPFGVLDGRCWVILLIPNHCIFFYFSFVSSLIPLRSQILPSSWPNAALALAILALTSSTICITLDNVLLR